MTKPDLPLYYPGKSLADMEAMLRAGYLKGAGWIESAEARMALRGGQPLPWFTYPAIAFLERELTADLRLFEYGGGQSTLYWAGRLARVESVDHDAAFVAHIAPRLPAHARLTHVPEGTEVAPGIAARLGLRSGPLPGPLPDLPEPERTEQTYRGGQLNALFRDYALRLLAWPEDAFDVVVVDGMARVLSTWAAIRHFRRGGFVVFDNAEREAYAPAYAMLAEAGYRRIDFRGLGPVNPYEWCTSVFYRPAAFPAGQWFPRPAAEPTPEPAPEPAAIPDGRLGILVLGYNRPQHLQAVLESLRLQDALGTTHVWIDGTQDRGEHAGASRDTAKVARRYEVAEVRAMASHLGIEKLMLDALATMSAAYDRVLVLEDDCFPLEGAVTAFEAALAGIADEPRIFSVYGHHFGVEPPEDPDFPRFQGWGWAAHSTRIREILPELGRLFALSEADYLAEVAAGLTETVRRRLDVTGPRNVLTVLGRYFSWDSATAYLTAARGQRHRRTAAPVVTNTGISPGIGHFHADGPFLRAPPFGMIPLAEAWDHWDRTTAPCPARAASYGLDALDLKIRAALPDGPPGRFVEIGAHDGVTQSNSVLLERDGWRGLLIEAVPGAYARCRRARPLAEVAHAACVAAEFETATTTITDVGLMSMTRESGLQDAARQDWIDRGAGFAGRPPQEIEVPAATMSALLDRHRIGAPDLLLLDVEGAEIEVLKGLDFARHAPARIVAEDAYDDAVGAFLGARGYRRAQVLLERKFTRDCLYVREVSP